MGPQRIAYRMQSMHVLGKHSLHNRKNTMYESCWMWQDGLLSQGYGNLVSRIHQQIPKVSSSGRRLQVRICVWISVQGLHVWAGSCTYITSLTWLDYFFHFEFLVAKFFLPKRKKQSSHARLVHYMIYFYLNTTACVYYV